MKNTINELEALNNVCNSNPFDIRVIGYYSEDRRKKDKYICISNLGPVISPVLCYNEMNCFILGLKAANKCNLILR